MKRFGELLSDALSGTMSQIFGDSASELIYTLLERQTCLKRQEAGANIEAFHAYVKKLAGSEIAQIILSVSLKGLCVKLQREYEQVESYFSFLDELYEMKFKLLAPPLKEELPACN